MSECVWKQAKTCSSCAGKKTKTNKHFFHALTIFWSVKRRYKDAFFPIHYHLSPVILASTAVLLFLQLLLGISRSNFHCYTQREATPTQKSARKWQLRPFATSCAKDYEGHSLVQISFAELPNIVHRCGSNTIPISCAAPVHHTVPIVCMPHPSTLFLYNALLHPITLFLYCALPHPITLFLYRALLQIITLFAYRALFQHIRPFLYRALLQPITAQTNSQRVLTQCRIAGSSPIQKWRD